MTRRVQGEGDLAACVAVLDILTWDKSNPSGLRPTPIAASPSGDLGQWRQKSGTAGAALTAQGVAGGLGLRSLCDLSSSSSLCTVELNAVSRCKFARRLLRAAPAFSPPRNAQRLAGSLQGVGGGSDRSFDLPTSQRIFVSS